MLNDTKIQEYKEAAHDILDSVGVSIANINIAVKDTVEILKSYNCQLGFADDRVDIANLSSDNRFALPRLDTNDFPFESNALPNEWTRKVLN